MKAAKKSPSTINKNDLDAKPRKDPFDLNSTDTRKALIERAGVNYKKFHRTLELHIYTPL